MTIEYTKKNSGGERQSLCDIVSKPIRIHGSPVKSVGAKRFCAKSQRDQMIDTRILWD